MARGDTGWQRDGTYVACIDCGLVPEPDRDDELASFSVALHVMPRTPGTAIHRGDCPRVALPKEVQRELQETFDEMDRCRRRAEAEARFYVIG